MGNAAHPLNKAAGTEVIVSQDCLLVLSYGSHHGTMGQQAFQLVGVHSAPWSVGRMFDTPVLDDVLVHNINVQVLPQRLQMSLYCIIPVFYISLMLHAG